MASPVILSIDQGTTNSKALLVGADGQIRLSHSRPMEVAYPQPGWAEQSGEAIWRTVVELVDDLVRAAPDLEIAALALSNQRETILLWDAATGVPLAPAILWQCRRSAERCAALRDAGHEEEIAARTGLGLDPLFPAAKIGWLLDSLPLARERAERGELRCGTVDSWLLWKLTGGAVHATDHSNASRTQLFNLDTLEWDPVLADLFQVPMSLLPRVMPSDSLFGTVAEGVTALPPGTPIRAMLGDSHAALFGHGAEVPGRIKATIGTGSSLMAATQERIRSVHGLSSTIAWSRGSSVQYALEGNISVSGQAAAFMISLLGLVDEVALSKLAASVPDSGGVVFVPALAGLGAPHWCASARGEISGMSLGTRPAHLARAALEAIALQIGDVFAAIEADLGMRLPELLVDGGATRNGLLMQLLSDLLDRDVVRPSVSEAGALGVARLALQALGLGRVDDRADPADRFTPAIGAEEREKIVTNWRRGVAHAKG